MSPGDWWSEFLVLRVLADVLGAIVLVALLAAVFTFFRSPGAPSSGRHQRAKGAAA